MTKIARRRKDAAEKATTRIARKHGVVVMEDLKVQNMTASARGTVQEPGRNVAQKAGLNRAILDVAPGFIRRRQEQKLAASGGILITVPARHTSQRCNKCGHIDPENRRSQSVFFCTACGYLANADFNASCNIRDRGLGLWGQDPKPAQKAISTKRRGTSVSAWGGTRVSGPMNQEVRAREGAKEIAA
jgi:putative transposase